MIDPAPAQIAPIAPVVPEAVAPDEVVAVAPVVPFVGVVPGPTTRLFLNQPSRRNLTINTRELLVVGRLVGAGAVHITLEDRKAHVLEAVTIDAERPVRDPVRAPEPTPRRPADRPGRGL